MTSGHSDQFVVEHKIRKVRIELIACCFCCFQNLRRFSDISGMSRLETGDK